MALSIVDRLRPINSHNDQHLWLIDLARFFAVCRAQSSCYVLAMFSSLITQRVAYFGLWSDECRNGEMAKEALRILATAVERCRDDDVRSAELDDVLAWVEARATRRHPVEAFRGGLDLAHPIARHRALSDGYVRIARELGLFNGRL
jgi:hypothetical protein